MNIFEVEIEDAFGIQIVNLAPFPPNNFVSGNNTNEVSRTFDLQTAIINPLYPPYIKKFAKARKLKKYNTSHKTKMYGTNTELNLTFN